MKLVGRGLRHGKLIQCTCIDGSRVQAMLGNEGHHLRSQPDTRVTRPLYAYFAPLLDAFVAHLEYLAYDGEGMGTLFIKPGRVLWAKVLNFYCLIKAPAPII